MSKPGKLEDTRKRFVTVQLQPIKERRLTEKGICQVIAKGSSTKFYKSVSSMFRPAMQQHGLFAAKQSLWYTRTQFTGAYNSRPEKTKNLEKNIENTWLIG